MNSIKFFASIFASVSALASTLLFSATSQTQAAAPALTISNLLSFPAGQIATTSLVQGSNGNFYGVTAGGGLNAMGTVYMITPASGNTAAVSSNVISFAGTNGSAPAGPLFLSKDGFFYGTTFSGGMGFKGSNAASGNGTIFRMSPTGASLTSYSVFFGSNGTSPSGGLVLGPRGLFYGTTSDGGTNGVGEVFSWSPTSGVSNLYSFKGTDGSSPRSGVVVGLDGNLYGTTFQGGKDGLGTLFELTPSNTFTLLLSFEETNGALPWGLVQTANSNLFGATFSGGSFGLGELFQWTPSGQLTEVSFGITNGANPFGPLLTGRDGFLYGTTLQGGLYGQGEVFRVTNNFSPSGSSGFRGRAEGASTNAPVVLETSFQATGKAGAYPESELMQASNGNYYGTTSSGGANGTGTVFELLGFAPTIYLQPSGAPFAAKTTSGFSVGATGSGPLNYQWMFDGANLVNAAGISGATNSQLIIGPQVLADAGSYSVVITNSFGAVTSSIIELSVPAPVLTITSPKTRVTETIATLLVKGTASDKYGLSGVMWQLDGGTNWTEAKTTNQWTNWSATMTLSPGSNVFKAYSIDTLGNHSATQSIQVFYSVDSPLTLLTTGFGTITRSFKGNTLEIGTNYTVSAKPSVNNLFSGWTGGVTATNNPLTFLMQPDMILTANFVTNSFLYAAGTYNGLFYVTNGIGAQSSGMLRSLTIGKLGAYSASLSIGGSNYGITGNFDVAGNTSNQIARTFALGPLSLVMNLNWATKPPQVTGTVSGKSSGASWTASLVAEEVGTGIASAAYTLLIPPATDAPLVSPIGDGYAVITNHAGTTILTGALADGAALTETVAESQSGYLAVYAAPYTNGGLLLGWLALTNGAPEGSLTWIKPPSGSALYPEGFTNVVAVQSSIWDAPGGGAICQSILAAQLDVFGAFLPAPLDFNVGVDCQDDVLAGGGLTNSLTTSMNLKTGLLKITFGNGNGKKTTAGTGVLLQDNRTGGGYFITSTNAGAFTLQPLSP